MTKNMGSIDRTLRIAFAAVVAALYFTRRIDGTLAIVLGVIAAIALVTGLLGWCGLYVLLGISTHKEPTPAAKA